MTLDVLQPKLLSPKAAQFSIESLLAPDTSTMPSYESFSPVPAMLGLHLAMLSRASFSSPSPNNISPTTTLHIYRTSNNLSDNLRREEEIDQKKVARSSNSINDGDRMSSIKHHVLPRKPGRPSGSRVAGHQFTRDQFQSNEQQVPISMLSRELGSNDAILASVKCKLESNELWARFSQLGTEMIITKTGRRMFPTIRVSFTGLSPGQHYAVALDIRGVDTKRYRYAYHRSSWLVAGKSDPPAPYRLYTHPDTPLCGEQLENQILSFEKLKLTNNELDNTGHVILNSMHKYQPRIHIVLLPNDTTGLQLPLGNLDEVPHKTFTFPESIFTAVTAYQNQLITKLKIDCNPFAKGFRDSSRLSDFERETMESILSRHIVSGKSSQINTSALLGLLSSISNKNSRSQQRNENLKLPSQQRQSATWQGSLRNTSEKDSQPETKEKIQFRFSPVSKSQVDVENHNMNFSLAKPTITSLNSLRVNIPTQETSVTSSSAHPMSRANDSFSSNSYQMRLQPSILPSSSLRLNAGIEIPSPHQLFPSHSPLLSTLWPSRQQKQSAINSLPPRPITSLFNPTMALSKLEASIRSAQTLSMKFQIASNLNRNNNIANEMDRLPMAENKTKCFQQSNNVGGDPQPGDAEAKILNFPVKSDESYTNDSKDDDKEEQSDSWQCQETPSHPAVKPRDPILSEAVNLCQRKRPVDREDSRHCECKKVCLP